MKLKNSLPHMKNSNIEVNGNSYRVVDSILEIEDEIGISYLLQNSAWHKVLERTPVRTPIQSNINVDYSKMHKKELIALLNYRNISFDPELKKPELLELVQNLQLGE